MANSGSGGAISMKLLFLGGVGDDVTGSSTLISLEIDGKERYGLVDAGGFQGEGNRNYFFPVNASSLDFVVITHAHYDHIGLLPKLYKDGFNGKVYITEQAKAQGHLILQDAANINLRNSEYVKCGGNNLKNQKVKFEKGKKKATSLRDIRNYDDTISQIDEITDSLLYSHDDVAGVINLYEVVKPNSFFEIYEGKVYGRVIPTTHQNGAVQLELYTANENESLGVLFTGDIGPKVSLLYDAEMNFVNNKINFGIIESLHGTDAPLETLEDSIAALEKLIKTSIKKGKTVVLSGFSLDRDAILVYLINKMYEKGATFKSYFDAPLALSELICYQNSYKREYELSVHENKKMPWFRDLGANPFSLDKFEVVTNINEHIRLMNTTSPKVIVTSSANGNGGRIVDFFDKFIQDSNTVFVFCGWIYPESPSKLLLDTQSGQIVDLGYARYKKKCETVQLHGFSSHGYIDDIIEKFYYYPCMEHVILNHGELNSKEAVADVLLETFGVRSEIPMMYDAYELSKSEIRKLESLEVQTFFGEVLNDFNMRCVLEELETKRKEKSEG